MYYSNVAERNAEKRLDISLEIVLYKPLEEFIIYEVVADETAASWSPTCIFSRKIYKTA